jgi:hypothetical protein
VVSSTSRRRRVAAPDLTGDDVVAARLSRRRLCWGGVALVAAAGTALVAGCGDDGGNGTGASGSGTSNRDDGAGDGSGAGGGDGRPVMYSSPTCGCCAQYAEYLRASGHDVDVQHLDEGGLGEIKDQAGIPAEAEGCHTTMIGNYAVEGHVPVEAIDKLLAERPAVDAIALPGMPTGSPGMSGPKTAPFEIVSVTAGTTAPYLTI